MRSEETIEAIKEVLAYERADTHHIISSFFNLLFWKNYANGYVNVEDKNSILNEIVKHSEERHKEDGLSLDTYGILPFINKIRKQIGLPELTNELDNILQEITPDIRKRLILKGLK